MYDWLKVDGIIEPPEDIPPHNRAPTPDTPPGTPPAEPQDELGPSVPLFFNKFYPRTYCEPHGITCRPQSLQQASRNCNWRVREHNTEQGASCGPQCSRN